MKPGRTHPDLNVHVAPHCDVDVLIRFRNSEATLPEVLAGVERQSLRPARILGVDTGSTDSSAHLIRQAGGEILTWTRPYSHPATVNFGLVHCTAPLVLILSSHTVLLDKDVLERMTNAMDDPGVACVSGAWDDDPFYRDEIDWEELCEKGLKFGSIYSNSMGMLRRDRWQEFPFQEELEGCEDYSWAVEQLKRGHTCRRLRFAFDYQRSRTDRTHHLCREAFQLAKRTGLKSSWLGPIATIGELTRAAFSGDQAKREEHWQKLRAWWGSR